MDNVIEFKPRKGDSDLNGFSYTIEIDALENGGVIGRVLDDYPFILDGHHLMRIAENLITLAQMMSEAAQVGAEDIDEDETLLGQLSIYASGKVRTYAFDEKFKSDQQKTWFKERLNDAAVAWDKGAYSD